MKYVQILSTAEQISRAMVKLQQLLHERASNAGIWTQGRKKEIPDWDSNMNHTNCLASYDICSLLHYNLAQ